MYSQEIYCIHGCTDGKQRRLTLVGHPLSKVRNATFAHIEKKYSVPGLHRDFAENEQIAVLNGLLVGDVLQGMKEREKDIAVSTVFPTVT